jgi:hypothetical protein
VEFPSKVVSEPGRKRELLCHLYQIKRLSRAEKALQRKTTTLDVLCGSCHDIATSTAGLWWSIGRRETLKSQLASRYPLELS